MNNKSEVMIIVSIIGWIPLLFCLKISFLGGVCKVLVFFLNKNKLCLCLKCILLKM